MSSHEHDVLGQAIMDLFKGMEPIARIEITGAILLSFVTAAVECEMMTEHKASKIFEALPIAFKEHVAKVKQRVKNDVKGEI